VIRSRSGSYGLLAELILRACGIRGGEPLDVRRERLTARVTERIDEAGRSRVAEFLGEICGASFPDDQSLKLRAARRDAQLMHDHMRAAFLEFIAAECGANPVLIVLEDLHWGDSPTIQILDRALRELNEKPLFVLALARPELGDMFPKLWSERPLHEIRLRELPKKAAERLARHVLGERAGSETIERIVQLADGNAFYLEELIRAAAEGSSHNLPETVVAMVLSRLGALDDESRRLLRAASVFGETFWAGGVASLLGGATHTTGVVDRLAALVKRELILKKSESRFPDDDEHTFRHALLREGAYSMLTEQDLALGHRLAGEWLEQRGEDDALVLAEHFEKGGNSALAGLHYLRAAERADRGGDTRMAIAHSERGLACPVPARTRVRLLGVICMASYFLRDMMSAAVPQAEELLRIAERGSAPWVQALFVKLAWAVQAGETAAFAEILRELMTVEFQLDAMDHASLTMGMASYLLDLHGDIRQAEAVAERLDMLVLPIADSAPTAAVIASVFSSLRCAYVKEDPWTGLLRARSGEALCRAIGCERYLLGSQLSIALNAWCLGQHEEARRVLTEAKDLDKGIGYASSMRFFVHAWALADGGSLDDARECAERLVASGRAGALPLDEARGHWALAEVLRRAGQLEAAEAEIEVALAFFSVACALDYPGALATLAALRLAQGWLIEALSAAQEGMAKYESMGACSHFSRGAFLRLVHAECLEAIGDHAAARAAIASARARLLTIAEQIGDASYRTSFLENVPENRRTLALAREWGPSETIS
jgi:tetratricopeptide (TPR) repeat protein